MSATVIVIIVYSSGMPILYLIGTLFFTLTYLKEKLLIIKYHKRTESSLSKDVPLYTLSLLRLTVMVKMFIGILMFTDPQIFETITPPDENSIPLQIDIKDHLTNSEHINENFINRVQYMHQQIYIGFVIAFIFMYYSGKYTLIGVGLALDGLKNLLQAIYQ